MSALDNFLVELKTHPKVIAAIEANATAGQLLADDNRVAHLMDAVGRRSTVLEMLEEVAGLFNRMQTLDGVAAVELYDKAAAIAKRTNVPIGVRLFALFNLLTSLPQQQKAAAGVSIDPPPAKRRLQ